MLTPAQIRSYEFRSAGKGVYRADEVDAFIDNVARAYEKVFNENAEMLKKISSLTDTVEKCNKDKDLIQKTLLTAQRSADELEQSSTAKAKQLIESSTQKANAIEAEAQARADKLNAESEAALASVETEVRAKAAQMIADAKAQAEKIVDDARYNADKQDYEAAARLSKYESQLKELKEAIKDFKRRILSMYAVQIKEIETLPEITDDEVRYPMPKVELPPVQPMEEIVIEEPVEETDVQPAEEVPPAPVDEIADEESAEETPVEAPVEESVEEPAAEEDEEDADAGEAQEKQFPTLDAITDFLKEETDAADTDKEPEDEDFKFFVPNFSDEEEDEDEEDDILSLAKGDYKMGHYEDDDDDGDGSPDDDDDDNGGSRRRFKGFFKK